MKHSGLQRARQSTRKKMKKSLGPDFVDPSNLGLHGKETSSDVRCDICHEGLPINSKKECITCKKCAIRAHATCVRKQLNVRYIKTLWLCVNCRHCYECEKSDVEQCEIIFCRSCERSYHYNCTENKGIHNAGKYVCYRCAKPPVVNTRLNSTASSTTTSATSSSSTSTTTTTTPATTTPNGNNRVTARTVSKSHLPEVKSSNTVSSHPSTSSSSSTPTPSTSRASYHVKKEMIMEKQRPRSHSNNPNDRQARSDRPPAQIRSERPARPERPTSIDSMGQRRQERPSNIKDAIEAKRLNRPFIQVPLIPGERTVVVNPGTHKNRERLSADRSLNVNSYDCMKRSRCSSGITIDDLRQKHYVVGPDGTKQQLDRHRYSLFHNDSKTNIDLPDIDMKDSFTEKPLTRDQNDKLVDNPESVEKVDTGDETVGEKAKDLKDEVEKQSTNENKPIPNESSTENSSASNNKPDKDADAINPDVLYRVNKPKTTDPSTLRAEQLLAKQLRGSGFVQSEPTELTQEAAKLLKDSNSAKMLKLALFERACKAENLLPAETSIWTTEDVFNFIRFIGFPDAADNFLDHQIDGKSLLLLSRRDVLTGFKLKLGPALKIYAHIFRLQRKRPALLLED